MLGLFERIASVKADRSIFEQECFGMLDISYVLRARVKPSTKWCQELIATDELMRLPVLKDTSLWTKGDFEQWCKDKHTNTGAPGSIPDADGINSLMCFRFISADKARGIEGYMETAKWSRQGVHSVSKTPSKYKLTQDDTSGFKLETRFNGVDAQYLLCLQFVRSRLEQFLCGKTARAVQQSAAVRLQHSTIASACPEWYKIYFGVGNVFHSEGDEKSPFHIIEKKGVEILGVWVDGSSFGSDGKEKVGGCSPKDIPTDDPSNEVRKRHNLRPRWCFSMPATHSHKGQGKGKGKSSESVTQEQELHSLLCKDLMQGRLS
jgi:hypothetical protein